MRLYLAICLITFSILGCSEEVTPLDYQETLSSIQIVDHLDLNVRASLQEYLNALLIGEKDTLSKYFFKDILKYINSESVFKLKIDDIIDGIIAPALKAQKTFSEGGAQQFYKIEGLMDSVVINEYLVSMYLVSHNITLDSKSLRDTMSMLAIQKAEVLEFLSVTEDAKDVLSYKFTNQEIEQILAFSDPEYFNSFEKINDRIFKNNEWTLVAFGQGEKLVKYKDDVEIEFLNQDLGGIIQTIQYLEESNELKLISLNGEIQTVKYSLDEYEIYIPIEGLNDNNIEYSIESHDEGPPTFTMHLFEKKNTVDLIYEGYEKKNSN
tara:strand:+ start:1081 stop:2049 length:969 start_codon:yes stop_codon:yes gene_type:complete